MSVEKEITLLILKNNGSKYKVTRRIPELNQSDTLFFDNLEKAMKQINKWT